MIRRRLRKVPRIHHPHYRDLVVLLNRFQRFPKQRCITNRLDEYDVYVLYIYNRKKSHLYTHLTFPSASFLSPPFFFNFLNDAAFR